MIRTELTEKALQIATKAHIHQMDKAGTPYILHPTYLAKQMETEYEICVALLHDVVEDTDVTLDDLKAGGFPNDVINALTLLTHDSETEYMAYIWGIRSNPLATKVKLADLRHNSDTRRLKNIDIDWERLVKYNTAFVLLEEPCWEGLKESILHEGDAATYNQCCIFNYHNAEEAGTNFRRDSDIVEAIHDCDYTYGWSERDQKLVKCTKCGALFLREAFDFKAMRYEDDDILHIYWYPVKKREEALMCCKLDGLALKSIYSHKCKFLACFATNDFKWEWIGTTAKRK